MNRNAVRSGLRQGRPSLSSVFLLAGATIWGMPGAAQQGGALATRAAPNGAAQDTGHQFRPPMLASVSPARAQVHSLVTLRGDSFGPFRPGISKVRFADLVDTVEASTPYVWRNDYIRVRVPVGQRIAGQNVKVPTGPIRISVVNAQGESEHAAFEVIVADTPGLSFVERTEIVSQTDVSTFLGSPNINIVRTKDGDIGDVNGDGYPDLVDSASNAEDHATNSVLRTNAGDGSGFAAIALEPHNAADNVGPFATTILTNGIYPGGAISYDADLVDLNNDGYPDWVQAAFFITNNSSWGRVLMNNYQGVPGMFVEATQAWGAGPVTGRFDDVAHVDLNRDGYVDVGLAIRNTGTGKVYLNQGGVDFAPAITLTGPGSSSYHDILFLDADHDGFHDVLLADEFGFNGTTLFMSDGGSAPGYSVVQSFPPGTVAEAADLDGDGYVDLALGAFSFVAAAGQVFFNDPDNPGSFGSPVVLDDPLQIPNLYDIEAGDVNLDGWVDLIGAAITLDDDSTLQIWINNGDRTFTNATATGASSVLPGVANIQRLSADLIDFDLDGDLDLYATGADGQSAGLLPNQFWENLLK